MWRFNTYFNLANPTAGYPYYYRKAAELWVLAKNKFDCILLSAEPSIEKVNEVDKILGLIHKLLTWLMFQPKTNANAIHEYLKLMRSKLENTKELYQSHDAFYDSKAIFLRHAESKWNLTEFPSGPKDPKLEEIGVERAYSLNNNPFLSNVETIYYSPPLRCKYTAFILSSIYPNVTLIAADVLSERFYGDVTQDPVMQAELYELLGKDFKQFEKIVYEKMPKVPGHENTIFLDNRVQKSFENRLFPLINENRESNNYILFITHGSWIESLTKELGINFKRLIGSVDYASPLLFYPFDYQTWDGVDVTKLKFVQYIYEENKKMRKKLSLLLEKTKENHDDRLNANEIQKLILTGEELIQFTNVFIKYHPRERFPSIDLTHILTLEYPEKYLYKLPSNEKLREETLNNYRHKNNNFLDENRWIDDNHILALIDGLSLKDFKKLHEKKLNGLQILIMQYLGLEESIFLDPWFSNLHNLLALKDIILNIGSHPKSKGKIGGEACGILIGLSTKQVSESWFFYEHALAIQRGISYQDIIGLTPTQALGLSCGVTFEQVLDKDFSIYHAYLMLPGQFKDKILKLSNQEAKSLYCSGLSENDITRHLTSAGYIVGSEIYYPDILTRKFANIYIQNNDELLMEFVSENTLTYPVRYKNSSFLGLAVEKNWTRVIDIYTEKSFPQNLALADYHAEIMLSILFNKRLNMYENLLKLEINVLWDVSNGINLLMFVACFPEFQNLFSKLFRKLHPITKKILINIDSHIYNPLFYSIQFGCIENVKLILSAGAAVTPKVILLTTLANQPQILELFCQKTKIRKIFDLLTKDKSCPLILAVNTQSMDSLKVLIKYGDNVNCTDNSGNNALHYAAKYRNFELCQELIKSGIDKFKKNINGRDAIYMLLKSGYEPALDYIFEKDNPYLHFLLSAIVEGGHLDLLKKMIEKFDIDVNSCVSVEHCAYHLAALSGHINILTYLMVDKKFNINLLSTEGPASYFAVVNNQIAATRLLLNNGADVNETIGMDNRNLLIYAILNGYEKMAIELVNLGIDLNKYDSVRRGALSYAAELGMLSLGKVLLEKGANITAVDFFNHDAFSYTMRAKNYAFARLLMEHGFVPNLSMCMRVPLLVDVFAESSLGFINYKDCMEYVDILTEEIEQKVRPTIRTITAPLVLQDYPDPIFTLPCEAILFQDNLANQYTVLACYELEGAVHYVFPKSGHPFDYKWSDTFDQNCHTVEYFQTAYTYCEGKHFTLMTPIHSRLPTIVKITDIAPIQIMLAAVLTKMGLNFISTVKQTAINLYKWLKGEREPELSYDEQLEIINKHMKINNKLACVIQKIEAYGQYNNIRDYKLALESHTESLERFPKESFTKKHLEKINELQKDVDFLMEEIDTDIQYVNHTVRIQDINKNWKKPELNNATTPVCYLPRFTTPCIVDDYAPEKHLLLKSYLKLK